MTAWLEIKTEHTPKMLLTSHLLAWWNSWICHCGKCWDRDHRSMFMQTTIVMNDERGGFGDSRDLL
jgi:hypothetical protein